MSETTVQNVKVKYIRPEYNDLQEWVSDPKNLYIARRGVVLLPTDEGTRARYPTWQSKWANPYKVGKSEEKGKYTLEKSLELYETHIRGNILEDPEKYNIEELRGKNFGMLV